VISAVLTPISATLAAAAVGDPESTRRVYVTVVVFVALGVGMLALAVWLFRRTAPEPQLLAPLEVMDSRRWRRSEPAQRRRELDAKRPPGARPLQRSTEPPQVDSEFGTAQPVRSFDDLTDDAAIDPEELADPTVELESVRGQASGAEGANGVEQDDDEFDFSAVDELLTSGWTTGESDDPDSRDGRSRDEFDETGEHPAESPGDRSS